MERVWVSESDKFGSILGFMISGKVLNFLEFVSMSVKWEG
jgi:hypothetical protein